jgi:WD40 repeat protein
MIGGGSGLDPGVPSIPRSQASRSTAAALSTRFADGFPREDAGGEAATNKEEGLNPSKKAQAVSWVCVFSIVLTGCTLSVSLDGNDTTPLSSPVASEPVPSPSPSAARTAEPTDLPAPSETLLPTPTATPTINTECPHPFWSATVPEGARARLEKFIVVDLEVSPGGEYFAAAGMEGDWGSCSEIVILYRTADLQEVWSYRTDRYVIESIAFSPDGQFLAVGMFGDTIVLLEVASGKVVKEFGEQPTREEYLSDMEWSRDGSILAVGVSNSTAVLWNPANEEIASTLGGDPDHTEDSHYTPVYLGWSPDGTRLAVGTDRGMITVYDPQSSRTLLSFYADLYPTQEYDRTGFLTALAWSPDGKVLAAGKQKVIVLWNPQSGKLLSVWRGHPYEVTTLAWSPDGGKLASGDGFYNDDGTVIIWEASTGKILKKLQGHKGFFVSAVDWTKDGKTVLSGSIDGSLILWNAE